MQLVEEGKLKLDDNLESLLPGYFPDYGHQVTVHHLLSHTSGIPDMIKSEDYDVVSKLNTDWWQSIKNFSDLPLEFEPETQFSYSNTGYNILGLIIEKVTGEAYEEVLKSKIFDQAEMNNSGFSYNAKIIKERAEGYQKWMKGQFENTYYFDKSYAFASGGIYSTAEDLFKWINALNSYTLLSKEYTGIMYKPNLNNRAYGWENMTFNNVVGDKSVQMIRFRGGLSGFNSTVNQVIFEEEKFTVILLANVNPSKVLKLRDNIVDVLIGHSVELPAPSLVDALGYKLYHEGYDEALNFINNRDNDITGYYTSGAEIKDLGQALLQKEMVNKAKQFFELLLTIYPDDYVVLVNIAGAYENASHFKEALEYYKNPFQCMKNAHRKASNL